MIELNFMTLNDYNDYIQKAILSYASELILSERFQSQEIAYQYALDEYQKIFESGFKTPDIYLYNIVVDQQKVGIIWFINEDQQGFPGEAFIGDFLIYENYRKNGFGYQALLLLEERVKEIGLLEIRLGVLKHNMSARKLYEKVGYRIFKQRHYDCVMQKILK